MDALRKLSKRIDKEEEIMITIQELLDITLPKQERKERIKQFLEEVEFDTLIHNAQILARVKQGLLGGVKLYASKMTVFSPGDDKDFNEKEYYFLQKLSKNFPIRLELLQKQRRCYQVYADFKTN